MVQTDDGGLVFGGSSGWGAWIIKTDIDANTDETDFKVRPAFEWTKHLNKDY
jgi:hypothetical protein